MTEGPMPIRVVAISHTDGAGGERIGRIVAEHLGFRYVDEEIISIAADKIGFEPYLIADAEKRKSLLARLVEGLDRVSVAATGMGALSVREGSELTARRAHASGAKSTGRSDDFRAFVLEAIRETADLGDVVIVSHAASMAIGRRDDLLRILITAPAKARTTRLAEAEHIVEKEAAKLIQRSDVRRAEYIRRFHAIDAELPTHYELVINTDRLSLHHAAEIVIRATRQDKGQVTLG
jgi:cytidylate kinase-like protein